jgi:hypothetical protein
MTFHNNLNYKFIAAMNKEATIYQAGNSADIEKVSVSDEQCSKNIDAALTWQAAIVAYMECLAAPLRKENPETPAPVLDNKKPEAVPVEENKIRADNTNNFWQMMRSTASLQRVLTRSFAGWMASAYTAIMGGGGSITNSGNWSTFLNILCSNDFKDFWTEMKEIFSRYTWLNRYFASRYEEYLAQLGVTIADVIIGVLTNWDALPSTSVSFDRKLTKFIKEQLEGLGQITDTLTDMCKTLRDIDSAFNRIGVTNEQREKSLSDFWDITVDYVMGAGAVVINTMGGARNVISEFAASVSNFIANNQEEITIGVLLALAIAVAVAGGIASGGTAAPALAAALLAFAAILGVDLEGYTQESIQEALERGSV